MMINTNALIPMTDANQNFSKVVCLVDEQGTAVILKNNKPRYAVIDFSEYDDELNQTSWLHYQFRHCHYLRPPSVMNSQ